MGVWDTRMAAIESHFVCNALDKDHIASTIKLLLIYQQLIIINLDLELDLINWKSMD